MALEPARVVTAVESLSVVLDRPGAAAVRAGLVAGDLPLSSVTGDLLKVVYRLLFAVQARQRGGRITEVEAVDSVRLEALPRGLLDEQLLTAVGRLLEAGGPVGVDDLGAVHEALLGLEATWHPEGRYVMAPAAGSGRKASGSWFTPTRLVDHLLDEALEPALDEAADPLVLTVLDPACGAGVFLVAAARRLARRTGLDQPDERVLGCLVGVDSDAAAVELTRTALWLELVRTGAPVAMPELRLEVGDALLDELELGGVHVVLGNPPFLTRLRSLTAAGPQTVARLRDGAGGAIGAYTDLSAVFLQRAVGWLRPGGRVALVQPQSVLAARDASGVRDHLARTCALESIWASDAPLFSASVLTCALVLREGATQGPVRRSHGPDFAPLPPRAVAADDLAGEWSFLIAAGLAIPEVRLRPTAGILSDLARCTADFRDQYYGLEPFVREAADCDGCRCVPLVTSGLVDPAELRWGQVATRFRKRRWTAPVVDLDALESEPALARWAQTRLVPKIVVGTQGRVVEAVADVDGAWLPSVPTITVAVPVERIWHVLAVLLAPPVTAHAAATYAGTALSMTAVKLSATQVGRLPLPHDQARWDRGAHEAAMAQRDPEHRASWLAAMGRTMTDAYGADDEVLQWWHRRLGKTFGTGSPKSEIRTQVR